VNVASLDLCKSLYELSGWKNPKAGVFEIEKAWRPTPLSSGDNYRLINIGPNTLQDIPAYSLGYLVRQLPDITLETWRSGHVVCKYFPTNGIARKLEKLGRVIIGEAGTPEDAAAKLCITLFKQNTLTREGLK
jgi:hypothetical protein